eukprot:985588-Alexandrium_andersonii.AAC.1
MPPAIVRQMGNNVGEVQRVMNRWRQDQNEELPDFDGAWWGWGSFPSESQVQQIRNTLGLPALVDPEFAGVLHNQDDNADDSDRGPRTVAAANLSRTGLSNVHLQLVVEGK